MSVNNQFKYTNLSEIIIDNKIYSRVTSHLVLSAHLNAANNLFGGILVQWADECAGIYVMEILKTHHIVTKKISEVLFNEPAKLGDVLEFLCGVKSVGKTSITIECITRAREIDMEDRLRTILKCDFVFVKIDKFGRPTQHNFTLPGSDTQK
jgi:acyl-CoA hydrolase